MIGFNGVVHEPRTRWQLLGNGRRAFNPVLMRFHSPDRLSPFSRGGLNTYVYCSGDPINLEDPSGHFALALGLIGLSAIVGLGGAGVAAAATPSGRDGGEGGVNPWIIGGVIAAVGVLAGVGMFKYNAKAKEFVPGSAGMNPEAKAFVPGAQSVGGAAGSVASSSPRTNPVPVHLPSAPASGPGVPPVQLNRSEMHPTIRTGFDTAMKRIRNGEKRFAKDGSTFQNNGEKLPSAPRGDYREFAVHLTGAERVGPVRVITGGNPKYHPRFGERLGAFDPKKVYLSPDHFGSFYHVLDP
jgi:RHS repeat-associated protein